MLVEPLLAHAASKPDDLAIIDDHGTYSVGQIAARAAAMSALLSARTDKPNVGILLPASAAFVASFYGTLLSGKAVVPINFLLSDREVAHVLKDSGIDTVVSAPPLAARLATSGLNVIDLSQLPAAAVAPPMPAIPKKSPGDLAVLLYTSGTSGLPKGVMLTYSNLQSDIDAAIEHAEMTSNHRFLGMIPLFHSFGITGTMLAPIQLGAVAIYLARFSPVAAWNAIKDRGATMVFAVPSMYATIAHLKSPAAEDFRNVHALISGGEPLPTNVSDKFKQRFGQIIHEGYGLTETSPVVALNTPRHHRAGSVGQAVPGAEIRIVSDDGKAMPAGQTGEIWLRGPMVMKGYHNLPAETAAVLTGDGYFKTGDLGMIDPDGYVFITGRKKDMIIVAGEKAFPREIEEMLMKHDAVAEAAVVGKRDPGRGEVVVAFVVFKPGQSATPESLRDFCRDHGLAAWKIPREFHMADELPRSPTGKVLKRVLAERVNAPAV
jgi:long-chain acyl-CoA synthetase